MSESTLPTPDPQGRRPASPEAVIRLSRRESLEFVEQIASLACEEVALASGLRVAAKEFPTGRLANAMLATAEQCELGLRLPDALQAAGVVMPPHIAALLDSAGASGRLGAVVEEFLQNESRSEDLRRRIWPALVYPLFLILFVTVWWFVVTETVVHQFRNSSFFYDDFGYELPSHTEHLFLLVDYGPKVAAALAIVIGLLLLGLYIKGGKALVMGAFYWLPGFGKLARYADLAEYANLLALLLEQSIPLPQSLEIAAQGTRGAAVAAGSRRLKESVISGSSLAVGLSSTWPFLPMFSAMVGWGEKHSSLAESLRAVAAYYEQRQALAGNQLRAILPPLVFLLIAALVQTVAMGLFMPLIRMLQMLS